MSIDLDRSQSQHNSLHVTLTHRTLCCHCSLLTAEVLHPPVVGPRLHVAAPRTHHVVQPLELLLEAAGLVVLRV